MKGLELLGLVLTAAVALLIVFSVGPIRFPTAPVIVAIGDSLTEGQGCYELSYPIQLGDMLGVKVVNKGVCGDTTANMRGRFDSAEALHPDYILIMGGHNDLDKFDVCTTIANLQEMYQRALLNGSKVVALTIPPYKECPEDLLVVNSWIKGQQDPNIIPVDTFTPLAADGGDLLNPKYGDSDLVHLNKDGYKVIADLIYAAVFDGAPLASTSHYGHLGPSPFWTVGLIAASGAMTVVVAYRVQRW